MSATGAGLIMERNHFSAHANQLQLDYLELDLNAKIVNRQELPDDAMRIGVSFGESDFDDIQTQVDQKEFQLPAI